MKWGRIFKWAFYLLPIVAFAGLLNLGEPLKRPMGSEDDLMGRILVTESAVLASDWSAAGEAWEKTHAAMDLVSRRIELAAERREIEDFYTELARLRGDIQGHERGSALEHLSVLKALYEELGR